MYKDKDKYTDNDKPLREHLQMTILDIKTIGNIKILQ